MPGLRQRSAQLAARTDPELGEHVAQVPFDRAGAEKQRGADLGIGLPAPREPGDGRLLRGELGARLRRELAHRLAGGQQFAPGALGERLGTHRGQHLVCGPQLRAGVHAAVLAAQPFAVEQMGAAELRTEPGTA